MHNSVVVVNPEAVLYQYWFQKCYYTIGLGIRPRLDQNTGDQQELYNATSSDGSTGGHGPPEIFLAPLLAPTTFYKCKNFEISIQYLLQIRTNWEDVQGMNMILLDCYCTLTYTNVPLAFFASFGFACKQQLIVNCEMLKEILLL